MGNQTEKRLSGFHVFLATVCTKTVDYLTPAIQACLIVP